MKKILLSGVKPTGRPHIGNYFGAMKQFVDLLNSNDYECYLFLADYHALNFIRNGDQMRRNTIDLAIDYLAIGLDPKKAVIYKQSDISAHTELCWILDTLVTVPYLMRGHAFKDRVGKLFFEKNPNFLNEEINFSNSDFHEKYDDQVERMYSGIEVGTFNYPVLMAADILLYNADVVPVGQDQKQHIEYARDIAQKFNRAFGETFKLPQELILKSVSTVLGTDGHKMSKSYSNTIPLFATREEIQKAVMSIVTDSGSTFTGSIRPNISLSDLQDLNSISPEGIPRNVLAIHRLFKNKEELESLYNTHRGKYKALKEDLIETIDAFMKPMRERRAELAKDEKYVLSVLKAGAEKANKVAATKLLDVKKKIGVL